MSPYPQAPPMTDDQVAAFLAGAPIARLASHNPDGSIRLAPAWFLYDGGSILIGTQSISRKARNVAADPQVVTLVTLVSTLFARMDQRVVGRPMGVACDRGAYEAEVSTAVGLER